MSPSTTNPESSPLHTYYFSMVEMSIMKLFLDHKIFTLIPTTPGASIPLTTLTTTLNASPSLLTRLTNFLIASGVLSSPQPGHIAHTPKSLQFTDPTSYQALFFAHIFDFFLVPAVKWPGYMAEHGLNEPTSASRTPFGYAAGYPDKTLYEILETMPKRAAQFNATMAASFQPMPVLGMYDFSWIEKLADEERMAIVDVGGGKGQALKEILGAYPGIRSEQCVLFDVDDVIREAVAEAERDDNETWRTVRKIPGSFFSEQPVKGAAVYHIRRVLNDWPDEDCVTILRRIRDAAAPDSRVLISEQILQEEPSLAVAALDLWMLNFGGKRRSEGMFGELAQRTGWKVNGVFRDKESDTGVVELVVA
ncbi:hypothetical protein CBS63078_8377 [Aspergillus niger]|uniref:Polysaccharide lyase 4, domain II family protein n=2 Tax=Aspergillus niger TaxID=5061 RepID=A0A3F3RSW8_ASPNG|nr:S-adenosyl-L-methionine-dependent methyltransferase [Aspergillus niger CBS 101883]KAI2827258.1 hypothetical protein CBS133816_6694 [Aspergillus niger]KAI2836884.1 hypothetical protein CBS12448_11040 [Aspergillus niger]KAI2883647.1 hypothetical protein CBS11852_9057 [Aspergillus niger]KAI2895956.1 hypothetical protein CBS63078_8377 [Aspergillus niger]KAI2913476.1 hypothetical protein CBS147371_6890 [Aspergillus niger]